MGQCKPREVQQGQAQGLAPGSGQSKAQLQAGWKTDQDETQRKDLGVFVDEESDVNWQCEFAAWKANGIPGCIKSDVGQWGERGGSEPLLSSHETLPGVLHPDLQSPT